ncbi:MAG: hypothetical protein ABIO38_09560, partial [Luteimonas sp.]
MRGTASRAEEPLHPEGREPSQSHASMRNLNLVALGTLVRREVMRILRIWGQTLVPPAITMTLY